mgnify:CR=1 FL=1
MVILALLRRSRIAYRDGDSPKCSAKILLKCEGDRLVAFANSCKEGGGKERFEIRFKAGSSLFRDDKLSVICWVVMKKHIVPIMRLEAFRNG